MHSTFMEQLRSRKSGGSITTADSYVRQWLEHDSNVPNACAMLKEAADKPVYHHSSMVVERRATSVDDMQSMLPKGVELPPHAAMVNVHVLTAKAEDRDNDILHTGGMQVSERLPSLWQHMTHIPVGRKLWIPEHTDTILRVGSVLLDMNELTSDIIKLVEADVLAFSHGFRVFEYKDRKSDKNDMFGFEILKAEIMEESYVSVPSLVMAEIELWSRGKLASDLVRSHAKSLFDARQKSFPGVDLEQKHVIGISQTDGAVTLTFSTDDMDEGEKDTTPESSNQGIDTPEAEQPDERQVDVQNKAVDLTVTDGMVDEARKALEWREEFGRGGTQVGVTRANQIVNDGKLTEETWRRVKAYFDRHQSDKEAEGWNPGEEGYPSAGRIAWGLWGGDPGWTRSRKIVEQLNDEADKEVGVEAPAKLEEPEGTKAGRALSRANQKMLEDAVANMDEVCKMDDVSRPCKALCKEAAGYVRSVLSTAMSDDDEGKQALSPRDALRQFLHEGDSDMLKAAKRTIETLLEVEAREDKARAYQLLTGQRSS